MNNKLRVILKETALKINMNDTIFSIGSCFSNELTKFLNKNGIHILSNPFGTVYNTQSIYKIFDVILNKNNYKKDDIYYEENIYFTLEHSTKFDSNNLDECLEKINKNLLKTKEYFKKANIFIITLGTSVVYLYKDIITANCHKLPHNLFKRKILSFNENVENLKHIINLIKSNNKETKIIISLSPIRHTPQDLIENSYSKSLLRASIEEIIDNKFIFYFPAFEIVIDELRNYTYYKKDMVHLRDETENYILSLFINAYFDDNLKEYINKFKKIRNSLKHKTIYPLSIENFKMLLDVSEKIIELEKYIKNKLIDKQKEKLIIKLIDNFKDKKNDIDKVLNKLFCKDKNSYNFFKVILEGNYSELIKMNIDEKILIKYRDKVLLSDLFKKNR